MAKFEFKQSKILTAFLAICLTVILGSTLYVAAMAYEQHRSGKNYRVWSDEFGPVATRASRAVVAIKAIHFDQKNRTEYYNAGSGFIFDPTGYILTNEHVIHNVDSIRVTLADQRQFAAQLVGSDARGDLAVLKINADGLIALEPADPASVKTGQPVISLGNPLGSGDDGVPVATFGCVTRRYKVLDGTIDEKNDRFYDNLIQTDMLILPGSSGGPLIDIQGRVIGVNSAMGRALQTGQHFGFSIALDEHTQGRIGWLKQGRKIQYAFLGVETQDVDPKTANRIGRSDLTGAVVTMVLLGFPAQQAGLRPGDVIVGINELPVLSPTDLIRLINRCRYQQNVTIKYHRPDPNKALATKKRLSRVTLVPRNLSDLRGSIHEAKQKSLEHPQWGLTLKPLTNWRRNRLGLSQYQKGTLIYQVAAGSPAWENQLQPGDVLVRLANYPIGDLRDFYRAAEKFEEMPEIRTLHIKGSL